MTMPGQVPGDGWHHGRPRQDRRRVSLLSSAETESLSAMNELFWLRRAAFALSLFFAASLSAVELPSTIREWVWTNAVVIEPLGKGGRNTIFTDTLEAMLDSGSWKPPVAGEALISAEGTNRVWTEAVADKDGWFSGPALHGGWAYFSAEVEAPRILLFNASGQSMGYVNGEPRAGDLYQYGYVETPVLLHPGRNDFLMAAGRGRLRARLHEPRAPVAFNPGDATTPDLREGDVVETWAAAVVVNATTRWTTNLAVEAVVSGNSIRTPIPGIPPLGVRKVGFRLKGSGPSGGESASLGISLVPASGAGSPLDSMTLNLRVRKSRQPYKRTFISEIDGSVQYYAIHPGTELPRDTKPALFLSLHGASVEGIGQAEAYAPKRSGHIVSPTNRRPYGFDWEDWGRLDALEVLDRATAELNPDRSRIYLTGHSMGGHGTWNFGATFPDRFAALAPSAGWISFFSYGGTDPFTNASPIERILHRSAASSDTLALSTNYLHQGIYVIHGDADDNVPISEARRMREVLKGFHSDVDGHEEHGAGHWWDHSDEPGADCVDWAPMFDFFARHRIPTDTELRRIRFVTVNPGVSSRSHWIGIEAQQKALEPSDVEVQWDPGQHRFAGVTHNVERLVVHVGALGVPSGGFSVELDGQKFKDVQPGSDAVPSAVLLFRVIRFHGARFCDLNAWQVTGGPRPNGLPLKRIPAGMDHSKMPSGIT